MKKLSIIFFAILLIPFLGACSDDDNWDNVEFIRSPLSSEDYSFESLSDRTLYRIDSNRELESVIGLEDQNIFHIDFDKYTMLLVCITLPDPGYDLILKLSHRDEIYNYEILYKDSKTIQPQVLTTKYAIIYFDKISKSAIVNLDIKEIK